MAVQKNRIVFIDFLKAIGIILMIGAHIPFPNGFVHYVHAFHMPLFFSISGFLYNPETGGCIERIIGRIKKLIVPYVIFSLAGYLLWIIEIRPDDIYYALQPIKAVLWDNSSGMPIAGALWYLTAMIILEFIVYLLGFAKNKPLKIVIICFIGLIGIFETKIFSFRLPWSMGSACVGLLFFSLGYIIKEAWENKIFVKVRNMPVATFVLIFGILSVSIMKNGILNMRTAQYAFVPITIINASLSVTVLFILSFKLIPLISCYTRASKVITDVGKYSIIYLCMNEIVINVVKSVLTKLNLFNIAVVFILTVIILKMLEIVFIRTPLKAFVGLNVVDSKKGISNYEN